MSLASSFWKYWIIANTLSAGEIVTHCRRRVAPSSSPTKPPVQLCRRQSALAPANDNCRAEARVARPLVSIIIPTRDRLELLKGCLDSIVTRTSYPFYEIIVVDNASGDPATLDYLSAIARRPNVRVLTWPGPFNYSAINNHAVSLASGEVVALLNNDVVVITPTWLDEMVAHALRPDVGAVGAQLLYADGTIQHAGLATGRDVIAVPVAQGARPEALSAQEAFAEPQNVPGVTAACLVMRKSLYAGIGGMDADNLPVAFNDVDLCLKLRRAGRRIVWTPHAQLYHLESASRGRTWTRASAQRAIHEIRTMRARWWDELGRPA